MKKLLCCVAVLGMMGMAEAAEIYVPGSYTTIQAAVNVASDGDTITVSVGTYTEAVYVNSLVNNDVTNRGILC